MSSRLGYSRDRGACENQEMNDSERVTWTVAVTGGPAFMANAVAALHIAADSRPEGPTYEVLKRLAIACEQAEVTLTV